MKRVAIVGFAASRHQAPFDDPDVEIWGMNRLHAAMPDKRWNRWFQLHAVDEEHEGSELEAHLKWLRTQSFPIMIRPQDVGKYDIPTEEPYPIDDMINLFGSYFTNTVSYMLAYAITYGAEEIGVYGVDMAQDGVVDGEYAYQRPSCEYFLGCAAGAGIQIILPPGSDLLKATHLYGLEDGGVLRVKYEERFKELQARKQEMQNQLATIDSQRAQLIGAMNQMDGAMQDVQYWRRNWAQSKETT